MRTRLLVTCIAAVMMVIAPTDVRGQAPNGATAQCKDGTYSHAKTHSGACSHHGGVAKWMS